MKEAAVESTEQEENTKHKKAAQESGLDSPTFKY